MYWLKMKWHEYWFFHFSAFYGTVGVKKEIDRKMVYHGEMWEQYMDYRAARKGAKA